ncbi:MAG: PaaI family thioesterase [Pseudomonadota bacterium]
MSNELPRDKGCFVCGSENPYGLKLRFNVEGDHSVSAKFSPPKHLIGYKDIMHGGAISAVLDDAMCWALYKSTGKFYVTSQMTVNFKKPAPMDCELRVAGHAVRKDTNRARKMEHAKAQLIDTGGDVIAEAEGIFFQHPEALV